MKLLLLLLQWKKKTTDFRSYNLELHTNFTLDKDINISENEWMTPQITEKNKPHLHYWINEEKKNSTNDTPKPCRTLHKQQLFIFSKQLKLPKVRRGKKNYAEKV